MRLDQELVIRGLARSRTQAARLVAEGRVKVSGVIARKPAMSVDTETDISADTEKWVSRAAHKLLGAIEESGTSMEGRVLDAGASTGGFTQVVLAQGEAGLRSRRRTPSARRSDPLGSAGPGPGGPEPA